MKYLLFTYPNCPKCDGLKSFLGATELGGDEYNLTRKEGKLKIRNYLNVKLPDLNDHAGQFFLTAHLVFSSNCAIRFFTVSITPARLSS